MSPDMPNAPPIHDEEEELEVKPPEHPIPNPESE
jgi:hypothetical protein